MTEIFPTVPEPGEAPAGYVANPLRVQRQPTAADPRPFTYLDLIALANTIVRLDTGHSTLISEVSALRSENARLRDRLERFELSPGSGKIRRILTLITHVIEGHPDDDDCDDALNDEF